RASAGSCAASGEVPVSNRPGKHLCSPVFHEPSSRMGEKAYPLGGHLGRFPSGRNEPSSSADILPSSRPLADKTMSATRSLLADPVTTSLTDQAKVSFRSPGPDGGRRQP